MKKIVFIIAIIFSVSTICATNSIRVIQSQDVETLNTKFIDYKTNQAVTGFRVNIFSESGNNSKTAAFQARTTFMTDYPDIPTYLVFEEPFFKIKVGNFRSRIEAQGLLKQIQTTYPNAFVVKDAINMRALLGLDKTVETPAMPENGN